MLRLDSTLRKIQVILAGLITTAQLPVMVSYSDKTSTAYTGASQLANTNSTTAVDICSAPGASTIRDVDYISVRNSDTVASTVTIRYNDNATLYTLVTATLAVGDQLVYTHGNGWHVIDSTGQTKATSATLSLTASNITNVAAGGIAATNVQTALNELDTEKANIASPTFTGTVVLPSTTSIATVSATEISYLDGVTSAVQTQIDTKAPLASPTFTGVVALQAGAAATPSLIATGDTNTGMWFPAADTIALSTAGVERLRVDSSGNVGVGTTPYSNTTVHVSAADPIFRMVVSGGTADKKTYEWRTIGAAGYEGVQFRSVNDANSVYTSLLLLEYTGLVTIGGTSGVLALQAGAAATPSLIATGDANTGMWFPAADTIALSTAGVERLRIGSDGRVTGTVADGDVAGAFFKSTTNALRVTPYLNATEGTRLDAVNATESLYALLSIGGSTLRLLTGGTERLRITATGGIQLPYTNTATIGAVTINLPAGRVNIAAAGTSVVVTNSLVTVASHVIAVVSTNDATARVTAVVPAAGSFTIYTVATTAQTSFDFLVINAD